MAAQEQQLPAEQCMVCLEDILPNQPVDQCSSCSQTYHRNCITRWLITRSNEAIAKNCPCCRADMAWYLNNLPAIPRCGHCHEYIGPNSQRLICPVCHTSFHKNEILELQRRLILPNNQEQSLKCLNCEADTNQLLDVLQVPAVANNLDIQIGIQPVELNNLINNFNMLGEDLFEFEMEHGLEPESGNEAQSDSD